MKTTTNKAIFIATILVCLPFLHLLAQPDPGRDPSGAPIDGGISLLVAAGIGYGAKKVRDVRKKSAGQGQDTKQPDNKN